MQFRGEIGYATRVEFPEGSGVYVDNIHVVVRRGEVVNKSYGYRNGDSVNKNTSLSTTISIVANSELLENWHTIIFVKYDNVYWEVTNIDVYDRPRMSLTLGGKYNGPTKAGVTR